MHVSSAEFTGSGVPYKESVLSFLVAIHVLLEESYKVLSIWRFFILIILAQISTPSSVYQI
jgi:hypothetical protein